MGANLGDRLATMREAVRRIRRAVTVCACSSVYETTPVGQLDQPAFFNAAIEIASVLPPNELLGALLRIEQKLGRIRSDGERWGPRTIDLDVLWIEGRVLKEENLEVPHPRLTARAFALVPMLELVPDAIDPRTHESFVALPLTGVARTTLRLCENDSSTLPRGEA